MMFHVCFVFCIFFQTWRSMDGYKMTFDQMTNERYHDSRKHHSSRAVRSVPDSPLYKDLTNAQNFVEFVLRSKNVVVFSKTYCRHSRQAKDTLANYYLSPDVYQIIELNQRSDGDDILSYLGQKTGAKTVPRVFINGRFIGGGDDIVNLERSGQLRNMLLSAGVIS